MGCASMAWLQIDKCRLKGGILFTFMKAVLLSANWPLLLGVKVQMCRPIPHLGCKHPTPTTDYLAAQNRRLFQSMQPGF